MEIKIMKPPRCPETYGPLPNLAVEYAPILERAGISPSLKPAPPISSAERDVGEPNYVDGEGEPDLQEHDVADDYGVVGEDGSW